MCSKKSCQKIAAYIKKMNPDTIKQWIEVFTGIVLFIDTFMEVLHRWKDNRKRTNE